ncbi:MAG: ribokinase, partial [Turicibacter sp.]|nr:ribokinase [Turicibacter sp.]
QLTEELIEEILSHFESGDLLLLQNEVNNMPFIVKRAHELGLQIAINPAPFNEEIKNIPLHLVSYLILNEVEGKDLTNEEDDFKVLESLKEMYPTTHVLLTRGSKGVIYAYKDVMIEQPAYKVEAVDTTAAGDTFIGYFISGLVRQLEMTEILKLASKASSITVTRKGSSSSIPTLDEVQK